MPELRFISVRSTQLPFDLINARQTGLQFLGQGFHELVSATPIGLLESRSEYSATTRFWVLHSNRPIDGLSCSDFTCESTALK